MTSGDPPAREPGSLSFDYFDASEDPLARRAASMGPPARSAAEMLAGAEVPRGRLRREE